MRKILDHQAKTVNSAAVILAITSFLSALLGFFRDRLLAAKFGAGDELDVYYTAFRIPDFLTMVLVMGAISAAIIPVFSQYLIHSKEESWKFLANLLNLFLFSLSIISLILIFFIPQLVNFIAPGFSETKKELTILLTRIMLLSPLLLGLSTIISSVLRVFKRFLITALAPIIYNLGIIVGILFFVPQIGLTGLALGVVTGAFLHLLIQIPILFKIGFRLQRIFSFQESGFQKVIKLTLPRSIGLAASQINLIVMTAIASRLASGSIAIFNLAESLSRPFLTFIGVSFSLAAFPSLALAFSNGKKEKFLKIFSESFSKILFLTLPLSFLLFIFRDLVVKLILQVGKFGFVDSQLTSACFSLFVLGLFSQSLILLLANTFYATQNTKIPALATIMAVFINILLVFLFVHFLSFPNSFQKFFINFFNLDNLKNIEIIGLPLALSLSSIFQFFFLFTIFHQRFNKYDF